MEKTIFSWGDQADSPEFEIRLLDKETTRKHLAQCETVKNNWNRKKSDNILDKYDFVKLGAMNIRFAVTGWKNLKNKHLTQILDTTPPRDTWKFIEPKKGETKPEAVVEYNPENLEMLVNYYSPNFSQFFDYCQELIAEELKARKEAELKN